MRLLASIALIIFLAIAGESVWAVPNSTDTLRIEVKGTGNGSEARFEPAVAKVQPGTVIEFTVTEGLHTVTAYHPDNRRPRRIPESVDSFDSGLLKPGESWLLKIDSDGVYDYFCLPHERMGHAGRIVSGTIKTFPAYENGRIPQAALNTINTETKNFLKNQLIPNRK